MRQVPTAGGGDGGLDGGRAVGHVGADGAGVVDRVRDVEAVLEDVGEVVPPPAPVEE